MTLLISDYATIADYRVIKSALSVRETELLITIR